MSDTVLNGHEAAVTELVLRELDRRLGKIVPRRWYTPGTLRSDLSRGPLESEVILPCRGCGRECVCHAGNVEDGPKEDNEFKIWAGAACVDQCWPLLMNEQIVPSPTNRPAEELDPQERARRIANPDPSTHKRDTDDTMPRGRGMGRNR